MEHARTTQDTRLEKLQGRAVAAKKWARMTRWGIIVLGLAAIWQERTLAPAVHDRMVVAYEYSMELLEKTEGANGYLTAMSGFKGNGNQSEHNAITEALLKLRQ